MTLDELFKLEAKGIDKGIYKSSKLKWDGISKPLDGLGDFEKVVCRLLAINGLEKISELKKALVVFCADHGVVAEGISQCGQEVTYQVARLLGQGCSSASILARHAKVDCIPVNVGINTQESLPGVVDRSIKGGTRNFMHEKAMTESEAVNAIEVGLDIARQCKEKGYHILATGEMGIGNTTSASALLCLLCGFTPSDIVGRGAGLSDEGLSRKLWVVEQATKKYRLDESLTDRERVIKSLECVGGYELAAMTGVFLGGAVYGIPVMIDGALSAVSALMATMVMPECVQYMLPSHSGREKGTALVLDKLGLTPFINGDMALGEGTGALMAMPLLDMSMDFFNSATTFEAGGIQQYERMGEP